MMGMSYESIINLNKKLIREQLIDFEIAYGIKAEEELRVKNSGFYKVSRLIDLCNSKNDYTSHVLFRRKDNL